MEDISKKMRDYMENNESIIYEFKDIHKIDVMGIQQDKIKEKALFLTNKGNLLFYFYFKGEKLTDKIYKFSQIGKIKPITYYEEDSIAHCKMNKIVVNTFQEGKTTLTSNANVVMNIPMKELEEINDKFNSKLFKLDESYKNSKIKIEEDEVIRAIDLYKVYGNDKERVAAINGVSLVVKEGDFIAIMGPSGSGKSTLINVLSTIDGPTSGKVLYKGKSIDTMSENQISKYRYENLGFIFQDYNLIDNLTIKENVAVPLILAGIPKEEILDRINKISKKLNIEMILNKYPSQCSGGQCQRASCARALITNPNIIVADEPTGNLDTKNSHELLKMIQRLNEEEGITVIMVTHDNMIASYSKKLLFIRDGKIDEVLDKGECTQKEYFYKIVDIASKDSQNLIDIL